MRCKLSIFPWYCMTPHIHFQQVIRTIKGNPLLLVGCVATVAARHDRLLCPPKMAVIEILESTRLCYSEKSVCKVRKPGFRSTTQKPLRAVKQITKNTWQLALPFPHEAIYLCLLTTCERVTYSGGRRCLSALELLHVAHRKCCTAWNFSISVSIYY